MYDIHLTVREYPGCWGVSAVVTDVDEHHKRSAVCDAPETLVVLHEPSGDPLSDFYRALVQWCRLSGD